MSWSDPHLFEAIVRQMPDAVIFSDRDGIIRAWNPGAELAVRLCGERGAWG